jgi:hypothetical protein
MPTLFSRHFTPDDLRRLTGTLDQLAAVRLVEYADGKARGLRTAEVWKGSGFRFTIWLDRAMDIGPAEFFGPAARVAASHFYFVRWNRPSTSKDALPLQSPQRCQQRSMVDVQATPLASP